MGWGAGVAFAEEAARAAGALAPERVRGAPGARTRARPGQMAASPSSAAAPSATPTRPPPAAISGTYARVAPSSNRVANAIPPPAATRVVLRTRWFCGIGLAVLIELAGAASQLVFWWPAFSSE